MKTFVEIHVPGASTERHELVGDRLTLGNGAAASIRVTAALGLEAGHVELFAGEQGVQVQVPMGTKGSLVFEGNEHRTVQVPWRGEVFIGNVRLTFLVASSNKSACPLLLLLTPVVFIVLGLGAYRAALPDDASTHEVLAPALFDEHQVSQCPEGESSIAEHRAHEDERAALAKQERSAFDPTDGVDAVSLLREAQACFQAAGKADEVARVAEELTRWSGWLNAQYATVRLRLRVALDKERPTESMAALRELQALLAHQQDTPYWQWLVQLGRTLERKMARNDS